jgi:hypothetical protein
MTSHSKLRNPGQIRRGALRAQHRPACPCTATNALSNIFTPILQEISQHGGINEVLFTNEHFRNGVHLPGR